MELLKELVVIRPGTKEDEAFIFSTWLRGQRFGNDWYELIESNAYYTNVHNNISAILSNPDTVVSIACPESDPDVILGYSVSNGSTLHWIHVKGAWRKLGLAKKLVPVKIKTVTHLTKVGRSIMAKKEGIVFNPFNIP